MRACARLCASVILVCRCGTEQISHQHSVSATGKVHLEPSDAYSPAAVERDELLAQLDACQACGSERRLSLLQNLSAVHDQMKDYTAMHKALRAAHALLGRDTSAAVVADSWTSQAHALMYRRKFDEALDAIAETDELLLPDNRRRDIMYLRTQACKSA